MITQTESVGSAAQVNANCNGVKANGNCQVKSKAKEEKRYNGKEHNWAIPFTSRINKDSIYQHLLTYGLIFLTWVINQQPATHRYYDHLNAKYGSWNINFYGTLLITTGVYWLIGFFFMALDMNPTLHSYVKKYKIQPDRTITWAEYRQVCFVAAKNLLLVNVPITWLTATFRPLDTRSSTLPTLWQTTWVYFACMICEEAGFFFVHRAVHSPKLYARFHKMHHQFTAPVAFASTYCTLFEQTFLTWSSLTSKSNLGPVVLGIILINPHWCQLILFFSSLEIGTLTTHSDYNIPGLYDALTHDWHHYAFTENFGPTGLLDNIFGTNKQFKIWLDELKRRDGEGWQRGARATLAEATPAQ